MLYYINLHSNSVSAFTVCSLRPSKVHGVICTFFLSLHELEPLALSNSEFWKSEFLTFIRTSWMGYRPITRPVLTKDNTERKEDISMLGVGLQFPRPWTFYTTQLLRPDVQVFVCCWMCVWSTDKLLLIQITHTAFTGLRTQSLHVNRTPNPMS
jgi:hypothetical protein